MRRGRRTLRALLIVGIVAGSAAALAVFLYFSPGPLEQEKTVLIPRGAHVRQMAEALAEADVISSRALFLLAAEITGARRHLKAGEYRFAAHVSLQDALAQMARGEVVVHKFTLAEGLDVREAFVLLRGEKELTGDLPAAIPEGSLLPQTYYFVYGDERAAIVLRMQKAMRETLAALWQSRDSGLPLATPEQALTLASIVEKETGVPEERPHVASVFENRLRQGIKLQADPTVRYGIEISRGPLPGPLSASDLQTPSPYNTYIIDGLPPGPIGNPGVAALQAVLHPLPGDDLYFVATGHGGHAFAKTLEEHNRNVAAWRAAHRSQ